MLTRIEIDGFKTFEGFALDLQPFSAIVGPNASGKSNLFDALKFVSLLAQGDIRTAMQELRGEPQELFRVTKAGVASTMRFAIEVLVDDRGDDAFGTEYIIKSQRLRYELEISMRKRGIFVTHESCSAIAKKNDRAWFLKNAKIRYSGQLEPFIRMKDSDDGRASSILIRQDGATKRGRPLSLPALEATRSALSTISTAEFPHLYALKDFLVSTRFLEINPQAARKPNDRYEERVLRADASNLSAVLANLKEETKSDIRPAGALSDISMDLASLIPSVRVVTVNDDESFKEYSFEIETSDGLSFSSRVISDGTLRLLALLTVLNDPDRRGLLCFEEPENGVHEGRIESLVELLRAAVTMIDLGERTPLFQIILNTHSPAVMSALNDHEIIAADAVTIIDPVHKSRSTRTRMRSGVQTSLDIFDFETDLSRQEVVRLLKRPSDAA